MNKKIILITLITIALLFAFFTLYFLNGERGEEVSYPKLTFETFNTEEDDWAYEHTVVKYKEDKASEEKIIKEFKGAVQNRELQAEGVIDTYYLSDNYLILRKSDYLDTPPGAVFYYLFNLKDEQKLTLQITEKGKPVFFENEKYLFFHGSGDSFGGGESYIKMIDGKVVSCLISSNHLSDVDIKDGAISFKEETEKLEDSEWVIYEEERNIDIEDFCANE